MYFSDDNLAIVTLLEKSGNELTSFDSDKLLLFSFNEKKCLVFYLAASRNFNLFSTPINDSNENGLLDMLHAVQDDVHTQLPINIKEQAIKLLEYEIHSQNAERFYFDAH